MLSCAGLPERRWTSQDEDAAYVMSFNRTGDSHDSTVTSHPLFLLELRDKHPTKVKPHQIPSRVTTCALVALAPTAFSLLDFGHSSRQQATSTSIDEPTGQAKHESNVGRPLGMITGSGVWRYY